MALKDRLRSQRSKRFDCVNSDDHSKSKKIDFSSDSELEAFVKKNKVRNGFSSKSLMKESECFDADNDHIYTRATPLEETNTSIRKRQISEESDKYVKKRCFSKNAVMARLNRERKKKYVLSLEAENESLRKENDEIKKKAESQSKKISFMKHEILYLKGLLANSKELGQILINLKETTGLPVTSSLILKTEERIQNENSEKLLVSEQDNKNPVEYQPRIRSVNSGYNFPILDKDINLGNLSDDSSNDLADLENYPFEFEYDSYDVPSLCLSDESSFFNFSNQKLDPEFEECCKLDLAKKDNPQVGICLHVNQKRISVEVCSTCNSKAGSVLGELPDGMFSV